MKEAGSEFRIIGFFEELEAKVIKTLNASISLLVSHWMSRSITHWMI